MRQHTRTRQLPSQGFAENSLGWKKCAGGEKVIPSFSRKMDIRLRFCQRGCCFEKNRYDQKPAPFGNDEIERGEYVGMTALWP